MTLGDRIAVLREGRLEQVAPPLEVYRRPGSVFVADFIGVPRINWFAGRVRREGGRTSLACGEFTVELPNDLAPPQGGEVTLGVRPQDLEMAEGEGADWRGAVEVVEALGSTLLLHARSASGVGFRVLVPAVREVSVGDSIAVRASRERLHLFDPSSGARLN